MKKPKNKFLQIIYDLKKFRMAFISLVVLVVMVLGVILLPLALPYDPAESTDAYGADPSAEHILGTDDLGRDNFVRFLYGGRVSFFVGIVSTAVSLILGIVMGLLAGYYRGWVEIIVLRLADIFMSFPYVVLILVLVSAIGPSLMGITFIIGFLGWPQFARLLYSKVISVREEEYVEAAHAIGTRDIPTMLKYVIPNSYVPLLVSSAFRISTAILMESSLSFLGMGVQPPQASWGNILYNAQSISVLVNRPWMWVPAGLALVLVTICFNFLGDGISPRRNRGPRLRPLNGN